MNIQNIVHDGLCHSCGACIAICPTQAVTMTRSPMGLLVPAVSTDACNNCGLCAKVCPGRTIQGRWQGRNQPFTGQIAEAWLVQAKDGSVCQQGQSGGGVSSLLAGLLDSGEISGALLSGPSEGNTLEAKPFWATTPRDVMRAAGSKYCPVPLLGAWQARPKGPVAVVGLACHLHALWNLGQCCPEQTSSVSLRIGLFCDRTMSFLAQDLMLGQLGLRRCDTAKLEYRSKRRHGWPGEVCATDLDSQEHWGPAQVRILCKDLCTPLRCRLCFDKTNVMADLSVCDGHGLGALAPDHTVAVVRTPRGQQVLQQAAEAGRILRQAIDPEDVFRGQHTEQREAEWKAYCRARALRGESAPDVGIPTETPPDPKLLASALKCLAAHHRDQHSWTRTQDALAALRRRLAILRCRKALRKTLGFPFRGIRGILLRIRKGV
jgi:coenzyme F420 hydrogenase subunit beta